MYMGNKIKTLLSIVAVLFFTSCGTDTTQQDTEPGDTTMAQPQPPSGQNTTQDSPRAQDDTPGADFVRHPEGSLPTAYHMHKDWPHLITATTRLVGGLDEAGRCFLISNYVSPEREITHQKVEVTAGEMGHATLNPSENGPSFKASHQEFYTSTAWFAGDDENRVMAFIAAHAKEPITVTLHHEGEAIVYEMTPEDRATFAATYRAHLKLHEGADGPDGNHSEGEQ